MSNFLMLCCCIIVCSYSVLILNENGIDKDVVAVNTSGMWSMVGFSIYVFEGIGVLMPVMQASEVPEDFDKIFICANITITIIYVSLGTCAYLAYGNLHVQSITEALPNDDLAVRIVIMAYLVVVIFTYPISIYPANRSLEAYTVNKWMKESKNLKYV